MRLRPSGNQGPVATSLASFTNYQQNEAWVWEHLALTRARTIAGPDCLRADIERIRADVLSRPRARSEILTEVATMRARIAAAKAPTGIGAAKTGPGRMMDIELVAQAGVLLSGSGARDVASGLKGAVACDWLSVAERDSLTEAYRLCWAVQAAARLLSAKALDATTLGEGGALFLCRSTGYDTLAALEKDLAARYLECSKIIDAALKREGADASTQ